MRYVNVGNITFTDVNGVSRRIKDIRPISEYQIILTLPATANTKLDEIASRPDVYGNEGYRDAYKLFDANAIKLVENCADVGRLQQIQVPV